MKSNMPTNNDNDRELQITMVKYQVAIDKNISESEILWSRYNTPTSEV